MAQRVFGDPLNTTKAYWPKQRLFLMWKMQRRLAQTLNPELAAAATNDPEQANPELHSMDCLVDGCDYLEFRDALEQGTVRLGTRSRGQQSFDYSVTCLKMLDDAAACRVHWSLMRCMQSRDCLC